MGLGLSDPPDMVQNEHPVDVRFAPTEAERRHKSGASASRYANIGQGAVCQWHTFRTDRSEYEDTKYGTIRKASFDPNIFKLF